MFATFLFVLLQVWFPYPVEFSNPTPLEEAYQGPGNYMYVVHFGPGDGMQSGVSIFPGEKFFVPELGSVEVGPDGYIDWQAIYDREWKRTAPWAIEAGYKPPNEGCWDRHDCPPVFVRYGQVATRNPVEAGVNYFFALLLRLR